MRLPVLLLLLFLTAASAVDHLLPLSHALWTSWKRANGRDYPTFAEEQNRMGIFMQNYRHIREHNERHRRGEVTHSAGLNQFADLSREEF